MQLSFHNQTSIRAGTCAIPQPSSCLSTHRSSPDHLPPAPEFPRSRLLLALLPLLPISLRPSSTLCLRASTLGRILSILGRTLELLDCLRRRRVSSGSLGESPLTRAKRLSTSVRETTPDSLPLMPVPGSVPAGTATLELLLSLGA